MKKIIAITAMVAAAAGIAFADEPVANSSIAEFTGNAKVTWGVDVDTHDNGFKNEGGAKLKFNLFDNGSKKTEGDGIWADLEVKLTSEDGIMVGNSDGTHNKYSWKYNEDGGTTNFKVEVDHAKFHIYDLFVDIKHGDAVLGEYGPVAAISSFDGDPGKYLKNVGPANYGDGVQVGYGNDIFGVAVDLRSLDPNQYSSHYAAALEGELKDTNPFLSGFYAKAGVAMNLNTVDFDANHEDARYIGYAARAGYKFSLNDTYYVAPSVAFTGQLTNATFVPGDLSWSQSEATLAGGVHFGWGDTTDANAGVYFLDNDDAKKVTPGASVAFYIPFTTVVKADGDTTNHPKACVARIIPSVYSGTLVDGLKFAAAADINIMQDKDASSDTAAVHPANKDMAIAFAAAASYDLKVTDSVTVTPKAGFRFANDSYLDNFQTGAGVINNNGTGPFGAKADNWGQRRNDGDLGDKNNDNVLNLKLGCDVTGLVNNTTFSVDYSSANLLNGTDTPDSLHARSGFKFGTLNFSAKISL